MHSELREDWNLREPLLQRFLLQTQSSERQQEFSSLWNRMFSNSGKRDTIFALPVTAHSGTPTANPPISEKYGRYNANVAQVRKWLRIDDLGQLAYVTADKHTLVTELGLPYRDLRILDPNVATAYPTAILIREKALVVHLECVRMIICKDQVLIVSVPMSDLANQSVFPTPDSPFVQELAAKINKRSSNTEVDDVQSTELPYELIGLEAALAAACRALEVETNEIESRIGPSLDTLSQKVSRKELETIWQLKSLLNRVITRASKMKQVLEAILDDDNDMQDMYLGRRAAEELAVQAQQEEDDGDDAESSTSSEVAGSLATTTKPSHITTTLREWSNRKGLLTRMAKAQNDQTTPEIDQELHAGADTVTEPANLLPQTFYPTETEDEELPRVEGDEFKAGDLPRSGRKSNEAGLAYYDPAFGTSTLTRRFSEGGMSKTTSIKERQLQRSMSRCSTSVLARARMLGNNRRATAPDLHPRASAAEPVPEEMQTIVWTRDLSKVDPREIETCEDLLDSYFLMADSTLSRLNVLREKIDDTEALITINLDSRRNDLVAFDLTMTIATTCMAFTSMTASIFGQNLFFNASDYGVGVFLLATIPPVCISVSATVLLLYLAKRHRLLFQ